MTPVPRREGHDLGGRLPHPDDGSLARRHQAGHRVQRHHLADRLVPDASAPRRASPTSRCKMKAGYQATARPSRSTSTATTSCRSSRAKPEGAARCILLLRPGRQSECRSLERLEGQLRDVIRRQHRDGDAGGDLLGVDHEPADGSLRARHQGGRRGPEILRAADVAARAHSGQD